MLPRTRLGIGLYLLAMLAERDHWLNGQTMPDSRSNAQDFVNSNCLGGLAGGSIGELKARTFRVVESKTDLPYRRVGALLKGSYLSFTAARSLT